MKYLFTKFGIATGFAVVLASHSDAIWAGCWDEGFAAGQKSCPTPPNCKEGDYNQGVNDGKASVKLPNCQEGDYGRGVNDGKTSCQTCPTPPNCTEDDYDKGVNDGKASCQTCPTPPNCTEDDYNNGVKDGEASCQTCETCPTPPNCQEGDYDRGYKDGQANASQGAVTEKNITECLANATGCTDPLKNLDGYITKCLASPSDSECGRLKAIYEAGKKDGLLSMAGYVTLDNNKNPIVKPCAESSQISSECQTPPTYQKVSEVDETFQRCDGNPPDAGCKPLSAVVVSTSTETNVTFQLCEDSTQCQPLLGFDVGYNAGLVDGKKQALQTSTENSTKCLNATTAEDISSKCTVDLKPISDCLNGVKSGTPPNDSTCTGPLGEIYKAGNIAEEKVAECKIASNKEGCTNSTLQPIYEAAFAKGQEFLATCTIADFSSSPADPTKSQRCKDLFAGKTENNTVSVKSAIPAFQAYCQANPSACVMLSLQTYYDYFMVKRGTAVKFPPDLTVPSNGAVSGLAPQTRYTFLTGVVNTTCTDRLSPLKTDNNKVETVSSPCVGQRDDSGADGASLITDDPVTSARNFTTPIDPKKEKSLEGLGYTVDLVNTKNTEDLTDDKVAGRIEIIFTPVPVQ